MLWPYSDNWFRPFFIFQMVSFQTATCAYFISTSPVFAFILSM